MVKRQHAAIAGIRGSAQANQNVGAAELLTAAEAAEGRLVPEATPAPSSISPTGASGRAGRHSTKKWTEAFRHGGVGEDGITQHGIR